MAEELKNYTYVVNGIEHTIQCTEAHAELYGATPAGEKADATTEDKAAEVDTKIRVPNNKSAN